MGWARGVPIYYRDGTIRCFAFVDAEDFERVTRRRWYIEQGYVVRRQQRDHVEWRVWLHREVLGLARGDRRRVDHEDRDPLNCCKSNLRFATDAQNAQNQGSRGGSSQHRGVTWDKSREKWMATAMLDGRRRTIGRYDTEQEAADAAAAWRAQHMPFSEEARAA